MSVDLHGVEFSYPGSANKPVLHINNWTLPLAEKRFIHGPSGCGKSTLLNLISGMLAPLSGKVHVLGEQLEKMNRRQRDRFRANHIGYVFQQFNLIHYLDAVDNIRLAGHFGRTGRGACLTRQSHLLLETLGIKDNEWHKPVSRLSIGQQQRIAIARALVNRPELLIADEPTSSLDPRSRENFMSLLMSLTAEHRMTVLFVSHDTGLQHYFDSTQALPDINTAAGKH
ncbi:ABC transporter ATP-binding protein [Thalassomonas viridans]|uniref:ABC transporter ATP-binding protein n=1 Tax=Thalassomonas viridans TaxID=137584 RepID=A0AAE9Z4H0_9GAMM|nr:ABC transporter ATP-binding protein [Thalassomonas viridans]WDE05093.1 ABC transporter ATP-binding protein [Thalassomonas viridans]